MLDICISGPVPLPSVLGTPTSMCLAVGEAVPPSGALKDRPFDVAQGRTLSCLPRRGQPSDFPLGIGINLDLEHPGQGVRIEMGDIHPLFVSDGGGEARDLAGRHPNWFHP